MNEVATLKDLVSQIEFEVSKFEQKGTAASVGRARKALQEVKKTAQALRLSLMEAKKAAKAKVN